MPPPLPSPLRYDLAIPQVAERLERAVNSVLDDGLRTGDIFKGQEGTRLVKCSEMGRALLERL